jgi:micrococcal nuclease
VEWHIRQRGAGVLLLVGVVASIGLWQVPTEPASDAGVFQVVQVVDGGRTERIRYIGMNTPEVHHPTKGEEPGGREAAEVNRQLVGGKWVQLEPDVQLRDRYGRMLAYVWLPKADGSRAMVNAELVRLGYAQVMTVPPNVKYAESFLKLQREAREAGRGLWGR